MSENIPTPTSTTTPSTSHHHRKPKRKYDKSKLPTPPPDPNDTNPDAQKDKEDFLEYFENLKKASHPGFSRSTSLLTPALITEEAFLHLEKLYKLMEQLLELREQNNRLQRRVRDLEYVSNLEKINKEIDISALSSINLDCPYLERDTALAESYLEAILAESKKDLNQKQKPSAPTRIRQSILRRHRSGSGTDKNLEIEQTGSRRTSSVISDTIKPAKVSKWTKVKAAFKWEKASVADAKSQDSGLGGMVPNNLEVARYLRVPSTSEDTGHSPADSGAAGISTPGTLSTASSNEDFRRTDLRTPCEDFRSSEDEYSHNYIPHCKDEQSASQKSSIKSLRTPWAKMKDIIHTRNSFKKKNRLSTHSDDIQIDIELCSDNEDVFEDDTKSLQVPSQLVNTIHKQDSSPEIPAEVVARYRQAVADEKNALDSDTDKSSKWTHIKKAFLTSNKESKSDDELKCAQAEINRHYKDLQKKLSLEFQEKMYEWDRHKQHSPGASSPSSACGLSDEARDPAFIKKMEEWQRIKGQRNRSIEMTTEEHLAPEFKKKLEEWKKIKSCADNRCNPVAPKKKLGEVPRWKSLSGPRSDSGHVFEYPVLSDDFKKKLEEWKHIKASGRIPPPCEAEKKLKDKSASPKLSRKNSSTKLKKTQQKEVHDKELQWFEKELTKIEREKQRLERERQKFIEREEQLAKLKKTVVGDKKEVLVHTSSGFYRFEGISRKFTQKLYEWEKAQGIAPEASTFALLNSSYSTESKLPSKHNSAGNTPPLVRSKSADSVAVSSASLCPHLNQQPSSLSLNDVDDLEKKRLSNSKSNSLQYLGNSHESIENDEPEALIVEVEDIVEETACPLNTYLVKQQQPIYHREEIKAICEGETLAAPKVRRSESARAQVNYSIIEKMISLLLELSGNENEMRKNENDEKHNEAKLKNLYETQKVLTTRLSENLNILQEANSSFTANITSDPSSCNTLKPQDILEQIQDLSVEIKQMVDNLNIYMHNRCNHSVTKVEQSQYHNPNMIVCIREKLFQLRRHLSYFCAASDLTAPGRKRSGKYKKTARKTSSNDSRETETDLSRGSSEKSGATSRLYTKAGTSNTQSQGAIKKRIKYRQKNIQSRPSPDTDEEEESFFNNQKKNKHRKLTRTKSVSDGSITNEQKDGENENKALQIDESLVRKIVIPTEVNILNLEQATSLPSTGTDSPVTLFVKTTRKLFTPIIESQIVHNYPSIPHKKTADSNTKKQATKQTASLQQASQVTSGNVITNKSTSDVNLVKEKKSPIPKPPLPASPTPQRKINKEISPSIRLMMVKYNQKVSEKEPSGHRSAGSSGSASPVAWRSPASERRVRVQTERYQEEIQKLSPLLGGRREVQKSASVGILHSGNKQVTIHEKTVDEEAGTNENKSGCILKSSSVGTISFKRRQSLAQLETVTPKTADKKHPDLKIIIDRETLPTAQCLQLRKEKLEKAREEFLKFDSPLSAPPQLESSKDMLKFPSRNRLSQISVDSDTSVDSTCAGILMKSASAGMINIDPEVFKQIDPELHGGGYVSLPRSSKQSKQSFLNAKFAFSNIASKFRKVRMKKGKGKERDRDSHKMNAVSALCRQSLVVDINKNDSETGGSTSESRRVSSEDASPSTSRSGSWIKKTMLFKK